MDPDVIIIGGGAAALGAARTARWFGISPLMVSDGPPGGDCTFTGCVPSKTLLAGARNGLSFVEAMNRVHATVARVAATEAAAVLEREGISVIDGRARLVGPGSITVGERRISAPRIVIATGARPARPPIDGLEAVDHLTTDTLFELDERPDSMAIIGGGPVGCELATAFAGLGVDVHLFEAMARLLPREEPEASEIVRAALQRMGVHVRIGTSITSVESDRQTGPGPVAVRTAADSLTVDRLLVAAGRHPDTADLGLETVGVATDERGRITVDDRLRTDVDGVYAVGDVTGLLPFTHAAFEMGRIAVANALRKPTGGRFRSESIPWVTFTEPEVARIGLTEAEAASVGGRVAYVPAAEIDRALTEDRIDGYVKLIAGPRKFTRRLFGGRVIGATIVAPRAGEMIHEPALAMRSGMFTGRLAQTVHAYPTWSTGLQKAAAQFFGEVDGRRARPARS